MTVKTFAVEFNFIHEVASQNNEVSPKSLVYPETLGISMKNSTINLNSDPVPVVKDA